MTIGICKYCGKEKELIKAHIIPKSFYQLDKNNKYIGADVDGEVFSKDVQNGIKDSNILCKECDNLLGEYDKYAKEILFDKLPKHKKFENLEYHLLSIPENDFDYKRLRKFFISLVWRASISNNKYTESINLGKYENIALKILKGEVADNSNLFHPIIFRRLISNKSIYKFHPIIITSSKYNHQWTSDFVFPDYHIKIITNIKDIKDDIFLKNIPINQGDLCVIETDKDITNTEKIMCEIISKHIKNSDNKDIKTIIKFI